MTRSTLRRLQPYFAAACFPWPTCIRKACAPFGIYSVAGCTLLASTRSFRRTFRLPTPSTTSHSSRNGLTADPTVPA